MALKLGTENRTKTYIAIGLSAIALLYAVYFIYDTFFSGPASSPAPIAAVATPTSTARSRPAPDAGSAPYPHQATPLGTTSPLDPTLHPEVMAQAEGLAYTGNGRNIFSADSTPTPTPTIEKPRGPIRPTAQVPQGPPPPPNIDLKFYGYRGETGGVRQAFLQHGEDIFLAREGDVVDRRYKIVKINPFSIEVEDLAYTHTQTLPLIQN